jgi:hypothetical protein
VVINSILRKEKWIPMIQQRLSSIPKAIETMWTTALEGGLYQIACGLGMFAGVVGVGSWSLKFYRALNESTLLPTVNEVLYPLLVVFLLANGGQNMSVLTLGAHNAINNMNNSVHRVINAEVSAQAAMKVLATSDFDGFLMRALYNSCSANIDQAVLEDCYNQNQAFMEDRIGRRFDSLPGLSRSSPFYTSLTNLNDVAKQQARIEAENGKKKSYVGDAKNATAAGDNLANMFSATNIAALGKSGMDLSFQKNVLAVRKAFMYMLEIMMLVLGLMGPIFAGLSIFPVGTKPIVSWATLFFGVGFCKICYTLVAGLSAVAMVTAGPKDVDMLVFAVIAGGLSPILAVVTTSIVSSSLSSAVSSIAAPANNYGINAGLNSVALNGQGKGSTPEITEGLRGGRGN